MPAPWVVFDSAAAYNGNCTVGAEPDISGVGVVISFVVASTMTTTASILAMILDQRHGVKGEVTARSPMRYIRYRLLETAWKKVYAWRSLLHPLIIGFGDQQLVTGYAVLLSGWIKVAQDSLEVQGAHFVLILYICALSSFSHLAALITLRKHFDKYKLIARIRLTMVIVFGLFLFSSTLVAMGGLEVGRTGNNRVMKKQLRAQRLAFILPMFFVLIGFSTALVCIRYKPQKDTFSPRSTDSWASRLRGGERNMGFKARLIAILAKFGLCLFHIIFRNPLIAFIIQITLAVLSVVLVLTQKFSVPGEPNVWCSLQNEGENAWEFGQTLSVFMLLLPAMSLGLTYLEGKEDIESEHG